MAVFDPLRSLTRYTLGSIALLLCLVAALPAHGQQGSGPSGKFELPMYALEWNLSGVDVGEHLFSPANSYWTATTAKVTATRIRFWGRMRVQVESPRHVSNGVMSASVRFPAAEGPRFNWSGALGKESQLVREEQFDLTLDVAPGQAVLIEARVGRSGGASEGVSVFFAPDPLATLPATPSAPPSPVAAERRIIDTTNAAVVSGGAKAPRFLLRHPARVTKITTYHWHDGRGATPGTIALRAASGVEHGPWPASGLPGAGGVKNAFWQATPDVALPPGTYTVIDSDPATWSRNGQSKGLGFVTVHGVVDAADADQLPLPAENVGGTTNDGAWPTDLFVHWGGGATHAEWGREEGWLEADGTWRWEKTRGPRGEAPLKECRGQASPAKLAALWRAIQENHFFQLNTRYVDLSVHDGYSDFISVTANGITHGVSVSNTHEESFARAWKALYELLDSGESPKAH
jgi:hypothetical protein